MRRWLSRNDNDGNTGSQPSLSTHPSLIVYIAASMLVLAGMGGLFAFLIWRDVGSAEAHLSIIIAIAVVSLMTMLFVMAGGFSRMGLGTPNHALGLPEGSIRALIALILIQIFIVFGIYLYSTTDNFWGPVNMSRAEVADIDDPIIARQRADGRVDVWIERLNENQGRLAQQLLTTVGTLVVAVAGFYFGSTAVSSAVTATSSTQNRVDPVIRGFLPKQAKAGTEVPLVISGSNFKWPMTIRLIREGQQLPAINVQVVSPNEVRCSIALPETAAGAWTIVVDNDDGGRAQSVERFEVTAS